MNEQDKKEITEKITSKNDVDLVGFFSFIASRIERVGMTEELEYRWDVAQKEILRRMNKEE